MAPSAGAVQYTDCISADSPNECPGNDSKEFDGDSPLMLELGGMQSYTFIAIAPRSTLARSGSTW